MKPRRKRIAAIIGGVALLGIAVGLVLYAFQSNLVFFFSPTQVAAGEAPRDRAFRIGGLVQAGSVKRDPGALAVQFVVTDTAHSIPVAYSGTLPDLFREGKGVVAQGRVGKPYPRAEHGRNDAHGNAGHGARVLDVQHRCGAGARPCDHAGA